MSGCPFDGLPWFGGGKTDSQESVEVVVESGFVIGREKYARPGQVLRLPRQLAIEYRNKGMVRFAENRAQSKAGVVPSESAAPPARADVHPDADDPEIIRHRDPAMASPGPGRRKGARGRKSRPEE